MPRALVVLCLAVLAVGGAASAPASAATTAELLAPASVCANQADASLPPATQQAAMACMVDVARRRSGLAPLTVDAKLADAAARKALDVATCGFSHTACGLPFDQRIRDAGDASRTAGENLAWGSGLHATVRSTMTGWLNSSGHRANILSPAFREHGVAVWRGTFGGVHGAQVWVDAFGAAR